MTDNSKRKTPRRPGSERRAIRALMVELGGVNYTTALREYERRQEEASHG